MLDGNSKTQHPVIDLHLELTANSMLGGIAKKIFICVGLLRRWAGGEVGSP